jgi:hypothetical protein
MTGVMPACAVLLLAVWTLRGREASRAARVYVALTLSMIAWFVMEVGVFASRHVGHLAERSLLALAPLLFLGFALWLARGAPRPPAATALVTTTAVALVASLPVARFASDASVWDTFTLVPLWRLQEHGFGVPVRLIVVLLAGAAAAAFALIPWRLRAALPALLIAGFAAMSVSVTREVAAMPMALQDRNLGPDPRWIDRAARGSVAFVYSGEILWTATYMSRFWNAHLDRVVYRMHDSVVPGPIPQQPVGPREDGLLVLADGSALEADNVVVSRAITLDGTVVAAAPTVAAQLWAVNGPVRLRQWVRLQSEAGEVSSMTVLVYGCRPGTLRLDLMSRWVDQGVVIRQGGTLEHRVRLTAGKPWHGEIVGRPPQPVGSRICTFQVDPTAAPIAEPVVEYVRSPRRHIATAGSS